MSKRSDPDQKSTPERAQQQEGLPRILASALEAIPVFPLPNVVLFPGAVLPLHIFEPRYRAMLRDVLDAHRALVIAQLDGGVDAEGRPTMAAVAGAGVIAEHHALADGRSNIVVLGQARVRLEEVIDEVPPRYPYRRARARVLHDLDAAASEQERSALVAAASMFASAVKKQDPTFSFRIPTDSSGAALADACAYQLVVDPAVRQELLEDLDPRSRVARVTRHIALQHATMLRETPGAVLN